MGPTEAVEFAYINELARGSIGLACIEHDFAFEADCFYDEFAEFADGEFLTCAHIDVAVANFTEFGDGSATACTVVAVNGSIDACSIMHAGVFLDADDVAKVHVQEHVYRCIGHVFAPQEFAERLAGSPKGHLIVLNAILSKDAFDFIARGTTIDSFDRAFVHVHLDASPIVIVNELRQVNLTHHGRHHMAVFQVEVVIRAVKIRGHHGEVVRAILQVVAFAHLEARNLSNCVFFVSVLEFACEQRVFFHRLRCVLRVDAGGAQEKELFHVVGVGLAEHVALNFHVHHHEVRTIKRVRHDATDKGRSQNDSIGAFFVKFLTAY